MPRQKRKSSNVWYHFEELDGAKVKCAYCGSIASILNGSTGNLRRHLRLKHPSVAIDKVVTGTYFIANQSNYAESSTENKNSNQVVETTLELQCTTTDSTKSSNRHEETNQQPVAFYLIESLDEHKGKEIDKQLLRIIIKGLYSFSIVEEEEFVKFVNMLNPSYTLPNRETLSNNLLPQMYNSAMEELKSTLKDVTAVALTTERWISINNENFISVTAHYLNKDLELHASMLDCISLYQNYDSVNIALFLEEIILNWDLSSKVLAVVTDSTEDMVLGIRNCNWNHVFCFAHILNTVIEAGLAEIKPFLTKIRTIIEYFKTNSLALKKFQMFQRQIGLINCKLKNDVPGKWNSTFDMLTKFGKNKLPLLSAVEQLHLNSFQLSSSDFVFLDYVIQLLIIFNSIRVELSSEKAVPLSKVPHMVRFMAKHLTNILQQTDLPAQVVNMGNALKKELGKFEVLEKNELVCQSVLLDPRFKKRGIPPDIFEEAYLSLQQKVVSVREEIMKDKNAETSVQTKSDENITESEYFIDMWSEFKSEEPSHQQNLTTAATIEIDAFLSDEYLPMESNPLSYWVDISNQNKFPALFELAKRMLCVPATSVSCERMYSKRGSILSEKRNYLTSTDLKQILFLHHNL